MAPGVKAGRRTRIKICGITREQDVELASELGVDAIGLVFYARSARAVSVAQARDLVKVTSPFVSVVGLFLDAPQEFVRHVLSEVALDVLQFHGDECPAECGVHGRPYIKAVPMGGQTDVDSYAATYPDASGLLLDSHHSGEAGGTGVAFDWKDWPRNIERPMILAGGLEPGNVAESIRATRPYGVDVSSGVELKKGVKDSKKMVDFVKEVRRVDCEQD